MIRYKYNALPKKIYDKFDGHLTEVEREIVIFFFGEMERHVEFFVGKINVILPPNSNI